MSFDESLMSCLRGKSSLMTHTSNVKALWSGGKHIRFFPRTGQCHAGFKRPPEKSHDENEIGRREREREREELQKEKKKRGRVRIYGWTDINYNQAGTKKGGDGFTRG